MKTEYKWFTLKDVSLPSRKTLWFQIKSKHGKHLGDICWHTPWRQYCFFAVERTVFNKECLSDIQDCITQLMDERKIKK